MTLPPALLRLWQQLPFRSMTLLVVALYLIKEQFPFSHFPMYSNFDTEADVVFIANQADQPLPMEPLFGTGSAGTKKRYETELAKICNKSGRDTEQSTPEERQAAGKLELTSLLSKLKRQRLPQGTTELRFYLRTFAYDPALNAVNVHRAPELLSALPL